MPREPSPVEPRQIAMYKGVFDYKPTDAERREYDAFVDKHVETCPPSGSTTKEKFTLAITPGGLGCLVSVTCMACAECKDITDTDCW